MKNQRGGGAKSNPPPAEDRVNIPVDPRQLPEVQKLSILRHTHNRGSLHNENFLRQKSERPQTDFQIDFQTDVRK